MKLVSQSEENFHCSRGNERNTTLISWSHDHLTALKL